MISALKKGLSKLGLSELPQDCVVLCGCYVSPVEVGQHLASAGLGQAQVYHAGVITFNSYGRPLENLSMWDDEEQERVGRSWLDGEGGCLVTHNTIFGGCESATAIFLSLYSWEAGVRSAMLRGVTAMLVVGHKRCKKEKMEENFDVISVDSDSD